MSSIAQKTRVLRIAIMASIKLLKAGFNEHLVINTSSEIGYFKHSHKAFA